MGEGAAHVGVVAYLADADKRRTRQRACVKCKNDRPGDTVASTPHVSRATEIQ
jgi:hypothetical protein